MSRRPAVILAAGASRRMGFPKARLLMNAFAGTETFLDRARLLAGAEALVVVGPGGDGVVNPDPERGMFSSVQVGVRAVLAREPGVERVLVLPVDHPLVRPETVEGLWVEAERGAGSVVPVFGGQWGHPVVLGRRAIEAVLGAAGRLDELLRREPAREWRVADVGVLRNVNTPERYNWFFGPVPREVSTGRG